MDIPKLKIIPKKYTGETSVISLRLSKDMIEDIDSIAKSTGRTRNELLLTCMEFALKHMEIIEEENK
ncbi:MAG: ribbon-helix-helix protein, CopG family [Acutalibacteraceae bacterium]|nr:ribbon-helix-helix protein, CopG family [Acutalibacteraceae bacterium]